MARLFGTDGIRGIASKDLTCELALKVGRAVATVLINKSNSHPKIIIGKDTRVSSDMLEAALCAGICSMGANVVNLGVVPTPAVALLVGKYKADAGIMISASHNSFEYNGIKIFSGDGYKLPDDLEERIESIILGEIPQKTLPIGEGVGTVSYADTAVRDYIDHVKTTMHFSLDGLNIAIDCANGSASVSAKTLFEELGANVHMLFDEPNGININDNCGSTHMETLTQYVKDNNLDVGVALDGDADRFLCVDENGDYLDGDYIMAICALDMKSRGKLAKNCLVGTIMSNLGLIKLCEKNDIHYEATKVGDRYVLEQMLIEGYNLGGEQSGHVIFKDFATTGDGQLTAAHLLSIMKRRDAKLSSLKSVLEKYPQVLKNITLSADGKAEFYTNYKVRDALEAANKELADTGRIVVRPSGTEPLLRIMVEGQSLEQIERIADELCEVVKKELC